MSTIELPRRKFLTGLASLIAAPAIVRVSSLMPVKASKILSITNYLGTPIVSVDVLYGKLNIGDIVMFMDSPNQFKIISLTNGIIEYK